MEDVMISVSRLDLQGKRVEGYLLADAPALRLKAAYDADGVPTTAIAVAHDFDRPEAVGLTALLADFDRVLTATGEPPRAYLVTPEDLEYSVVKLRDVARDAQGALVWDGRSEVLVADAADAPDERMQYALCGLPAIVGAAEPDGRRMATVFDTTTGPRAVRGAAEFQAIVDGLHANPSFGGDLGFIVRGMNFDDGTVDGAAMTFSSLTPLGEDTLNWTAFEASYPGLLARLEREDGTLWEIIPFVMLPLAKDLALREASAAPYAADDQRRAIPSHLGITRAAPGSDDWLVTSVAPTRVGAPAYPLSDLPTVNTDLIEDYGPVLRKPAPPDVRHLKPIGAAAAALVFPLDPYANSAPGFRR